MGRGQSACGSRQSSRATQGTSSAIQRQGVAQAKLRGEMIQTLDTPKGPLTRMRNRDERHILCSVYISVYTYIFLS